jgi:26S proteasome regulatory subunit N10
MEEERARQERIAREEAAAQGDTGGEPATKVDGEPSSGNNNEDVKMEETQSFGMDLGDEDAQLAQALAMSMAEGQAAQEPAAASGNNNNQDEDNDDDEIAMALALSMANQAEDTEKEQQFEDPAFVQQLMGSMPGVDQNDPAIQEALKNLEAANQEKKDEDDDKKGNDDKKE